MSLSTRIAEQRPDLPEIEFHPQEALIKPKHNIEFKIYSQDEMEDFEDVFEWLSRY